VDALSPEALAAVFAPLTQARLLAVLRGFLPSACLGLLLSGLAGGGEAAAGMTLSLMGLALGGLAGAPLAGWLARLPLSEADLRLPWLCALFALPLAVLPVDPALLDGRVFGFHGWAPVLLGGAAAWPLGVCLTTGAWLWTRRGPGPGAERGWRLSGLGACLGLLVSGAAGLGLSSFLGAFLVNVVAAPMAWPTLPAAGSRSLLARMLLTLAVVVSAMFLLFA
jgi:hypothetical protein